MIKIRQCANWIMRRKKINNTCIGCYQKDIFKENVDGIVYPTDSMIHTDQENYNSLLLRAGNSIQKDIENWKKLNGDQFFEKIILTRGGNLPCKIIMHTHISNENDIDCQDEEEQKINMALYSCLSIANRLYLKSIAIPILSNETLNIPKPLYAHIVISYICAYLRIETTSLREIRFINNDKETQEAFQRELNNKNY